MNAAKEAPVNKLILWLVLIAVFVVGALAAWWWLEVRWRPKTVTKHQAEIAKILDEAGWVSPGQTGPKLYMIAFRSCPDCVRLKAEVFPKVHKAGVDTRVIVIARRDLNGVAKSTPAERTTVAELWINRSWALMERWDGAPLETWTAEGIPPADGDIARTAVINAGRDVIDQLRPLLAANGVKVGDQGVRYPTLIWWTADGVMRSCVCEEPRTYRAVLRELGAD